MPEKIAYPYIVRILQEFIQPDLKVLEIGCGAKQYRDFLPKVNYSGLDLPDSPYIVEPLEFSCSADNIPTDDSCFDLIFGVATFCLHEDPKKSFQECYRVLKPSGKLIVFDYNAATLASLAQKNGATEVWNYSGLSAVLAAAGFSSNNLRNISQMVDYVDYPDVLRLTFRKLRRLVGLEASNWMIVVAEKAEY
ncbi:class I SAM-dependent methyltransferase [Kiloniella sp.]|uniref:class I SAM-dependent methyltransferase n=1 Tax=Kiloniella sp. TaxID=1938587 RepID=UPI003A913B7E